MAGKVQIKKPFSPAKAAPGGDIVTQNTTISFGVGGTSLGNANLFRYDFINPELIWRVEHNFNTKDYVESVKDSDGNRVSANIVTIDNNIFEVRFTTPITGWVDVVFGNV